MLFDHYIRTDAPPNKKIDRLSEMTELLVFMISVTSLGVEEIKLFTKEQIDQMESTGSISDIILFENLIEITSVFIVPAKLIPLTGAKYTGPSS